MVGKISEYSGVYISYEDSLPNGYRATAFHDKDGVVDVSLSFARKIEERLTLKNETYAIELERRAKIK